MTSLAIIGHNALEVAKCSHDLGYDTFLVTSYEMADKVPFQVFSAGRCCSSDLVDFAIQKLPSNISVIPTGGCSHPFFVERLSSCFNVLSSSLSCIEDASDWNVLGPILKECDAHFPSTYHVNEDSDLVSFNFKDAILKKRYGGGGLSARRVSNIHDFPFFSGDYVLQDFVPGRVYSCLVLSNGKKAKAVSTAYQLAGECFLNASFFKYCGCIVPSNLSESVRCEMKRVSEYLISTLGLRGVTGVDFIYDGSDPYVIEVNPRLVDSFFPSCQFLNTNLLRAHLDCLYEYPLPCFSPNQSFYGKAIFYAPKDCVFSAGLDENFSNVPPMFSNIRRDDPVCCIYAQGDSINAVLSAFKCRSEFLEGLF